MDEITVVRAALGAAAARVSVRPPVRAEIDRGLHRVRRRRRLARTAKTAGALGAVAASVAALQLGLVSLPAWAPAVPLPASGVSTLATGATRGSLAGDTEWLAALRDNVATIDRAESGGERWRAPSADRVDVVYAGDVGTYRIALVETPLRWGVIEARAQIWYVGSRGTAAGQMQESASGEPEDVAFLDLTAGSLAPEAGVQGAAAVLLGAVFGVAAVGPVQISASGQVSWPVTAVAPTEPGLWEISRKAGAAVTYLRWAGSETVSVGDRGWDGESGAERAALLAGVRPALRSGPGRGAIQPAVPDDERLARSVSAAQRTSSLAVASSTRRLVWSGSLAGAQVDVVAVTAPSGAQVLSAITAAGPDAAVVQPSLPAVVAVGEPIALAWSFLLPTAGADQRAAGVRVGLVGPAGATTARLLRASGATADAELVDGVGVVALGDVISVSYLGATGAVLATATASQPADDVKLAPPGARP